MVWCLHVKSSGLINIFNIKRNVPAWWGTLFFIDLSRCSLVQNKPDHTYCTFKERGLQTRMQMYFFVWAPYFHILTSGLSLLSPLQNLSGEDAAHLMHGGQDPACSGQVSGRAETKSHSGSPLERYDYIVKIQLSGAEKHNQGWVIVKHATVSHVFHALLYMWRYSV